ncbi:peptidylprolyl isomerase [Altererythrobacter sp. GH1-8]|uniref:peptidylprolyl isomerase n=1 Tax=Altererythrobacter sp. GH1-8 TaxID=3349333 RepID=UPI00374CAB5A
MTWKTILPLLLNFSLGATALAQDAPFMPFTEQVPLNPSDGDQTQIGELIYRGGVMIEPGEEGIGGMTGLSFADGQLFAVTTTGQWLILTPTYFRDQITDVIEIEMGSLRDPRGKKLEGKAEGRASSISRTASGEWLVSFEGEQPPLLYASLNADPQIASFGLTAQVPAPPAPAPLDEVGGAATGTDCASNGVCYILYRSNSRENAAVAILAIDPEGKSEVLASWAPPLTIDKFEGLAVQEEGGKTFLYIVSDNNFSETQRNLLMKFEVSQRAATTPGVPPKVYETVNVVIETTLGEIIVALETERAPITAANFLRYIDEGRFKDTRCYRAMQVEGREIPSGFVQCGTQNRPDRILAPIAHEPTSETGLSHLDGALSMARFEPGTATGDFSIMIQDQRGLDADPSNLDPGRHAGFAVFGYVVDGMDTVIDIQAQPVDPDKGEGFLKGQMLAEPVRILNIRRAQS